MRSSDRRRDGDGLAREIGRGLMVLGLTGSSVGGFVGVVTIASRLLGR
ncbi:hypothetical protein BH24ACT26_BH24ACT26_05470 [soil metagenome]